MRSRVATSVCVCVADTYLIYQWAAVPQEVASAGVVVLGQWWVRGWRLVSTEVEGGWEGLLCGGENGGGGLSQ
jgi:hypothetical protein